MMRAATQPVQRPRDAKLLAIDARGAISHRPRSELARLLEPGDLVVANDAATLPASLAGVHVRTGAPIEVRLAQRASLDPRDVREFVAVVFGAGDWRTPTEHRPPPPALTPGDVLQLGPLRARVHRTVGHPRLVAIAFDGTVAQVWSGLAAHGKPIQYAYLEPALSLWDVWTPIAGFPAAFEAPSAGFALDWQVLSQLRERGVGFATLTHAAGISSTGDAQLDRRLPLDEPYRIPESTAKAVARASNEGGRVIAIGTTVVRALEASAAEHGFVRAGEGIATSRIGPETPLRVVDALLSGTHEPGTSHYELLRAFASDTALRRADSELASRGYRTHEFGDSVFIERALRSRVGAFRRIPFARERLRA
jgi:S-adenosylmethionine:tRNA ribosyltransferase-isomerase